MFIGWVFYFFILILSGGMTLAAAIFVWRRHMTGGIRILALVLGLLAWWSFTYLLELSVPQPTMQLFFAKAKYLAIATVPPLYFFFVAAYFYRIEWHPFRFSTLVFLGIPIITILLIWTNEWHALFWSTIEEVNVWGRFVLEKHAGPWYSVHSAYSYFTIVVSLVAIVYRMRFLHGVYRRQAVWVFASSFFPLVANVWFNFTYKATVLDPTPVLFSVSALLIFAGIYKSHFLEITPLPQELLVTSIEDAWIVVDTQGRIVDFNEPARMFLRDDALGNLLEEGLIWSSAVSIPLAESEWKEERQWRDGWFELHLKPFTTNSGVLAGYILTIRDITERKAREVSQQRALELEREHHHLAELLVEFNTRLMAATSLQTLGQVIVEEASHLFHADCVLLWLYEDETVVHWFTYPENTLALSAGDFLFPKAQLTELWEGHQQPRLPLVSFVSYLPPRLQMHISDIVTRFAPLLLIPIQSQRHDGFLLVTRRAYAEQAFSEAELEAAVILTTILNTGLENIELLEQRSRHIQRMQRLMALTSQFLTPASVQEVFARIGNGVQMLTGLSCVGVATRDENGAFRFTWAQNMPFSLVERLEMWLPRLHKNNLPYRVFSRDDIPDLIAHFSQLHGLIAWPLVYQEQLEAIVVAAAFQPVTWPDELDEVLSIFMRQASIALQNAYLWTETNLHSMHLAALNEAAREMSRTLDRQRLLDYILEQAVNVLACEAGTLFLIDEQTQEIIFASTLGPVAEHLRGQRLPPGTGVVGQAIEQRRVIIQNDVQATKAWFHQADQATGFVTRALLVVPLIAQEKVIGALEVINKQQGLGFTEQDEHLAVSFAAQAAVALENARLFEEIQRQVRELQLLHKVAAICAAVGSEDELYTKVTQTLREVFPHISNLGILVLDAVHGVLRLHDSYVFQSSPPKQVIVPVGEGVTGWVALTGRPYRSDDVSREASYLKVEERVRSELAVPIMAGKTVLGVINLESAEPGAFDERQEHVMRIIADQMATAVQRLRAAARERESAVQLQMIYELGRRLITILDPDVLCREVTAQIASALQFDQVAIGTLDEDSETIHMRAVYTTTPDGPVIPKRVPVGEGTLGEVIRFRRRITITRPLSNHLHPIQTEIALPLESHTGILGVLFVARRGANSISHETAKLLSILADQVATALHNAMLYEAERRARHVADTLRMANLALTESLKIDVIVQTFLDYLSRIVPYEEYLVALRDVDHQVVVHVVSQGLKFQRGQVLYRALNRQHMAEQPTLVSTAWGEELSETRCWLYVPLQFGAYHIGACLLGMPQSYTLDENDRDVIAALAAQAASALQNAFMATTDELTGLMNRRAFFEQARREFKRAKRYNKPLAAIMIDLDHFKQVNDTYSHAVGDQVLSEVALRIRETVRTLDIVGRYGGEEIAVVAPETSLEGAIQLAERLRQNIALEPIETSAGPIRVTVSVGVAALTPEMMLLEQLLHAADEKLYVAKAEGRNRVCA
ncbi:hypothetical protein ARMA_0293 [Ardenticatena maritima]|uniref:GGDEF domain-containing protein n=2 Tax=Ardenticatena maritima TaxID=872965 RepID=A0A0M9UBL3_9CHLR|nr:GAF domain-containing protein [Ardenticatena maritima]GAP61870.1 hypothetical protein ARMA_0293 [Ardenticatena maritima]